MREPLGTAAPGVDVEVATWPPVRTVMVDGWRVGLSGGFTRRANSAVPPACADGQAAGALAGTLDRVEGLYADAGLPVVVRQGGALAGTPLAALLDARGYATAAVTDVLVTAAPGGLARVPSAGGVRHRTSDEGAVAPDRWTVASATAPDEAWLDTLLGVKAGDRPVDRDAVRRVLEGCPASYLTARDAEGVGGVVRVALAGDWAGLSCLMVVPRARRLGLATALTRAALAAAAAAGGARAFLQVERSNAVARALYERLGFRAVESYAYRERPAAPPAPAGPSGSGRGMSEVVSETARPRKVP